MSVICEIELKDNNKAILYQFGSQTHAKIVDAMDFTVDDTRYHKDIINSLNQYQKVLEFIYNYQ